MDPPRISLVMPSYNQADFLEEAITSVIGQDYPNLEFLLLDGGSEDASIDIIRKYDAYLSWWRSEADAGQASALREGFGRATGEILCWLNSDDRLAEGALNCVSETWRATDGGVIVTGACQLFGPASSGNLHRPWFTSVRYQPVPMPLASILDMAGHWFPGEFFYQPEVFFPAQAYREVGGVDPSFHYTMDYDLWARFALAGVPVVVVDETLAWYREHEQQKTDNKAALYREMVETANRYLDVTDLPPATVRRLKISNRSALLPGVRRARQLIAYGVRAVRP